MTENTNKLLNFIQKVKSPFHGVYVISNILEELGYIRLFETSNYTLEAEKKYYIIRSDASLISFQLPKNLTNNYFKIIASHIDSPTFKIKPNGTILSKQYQILNTEVYGGPIYSTWFDRPLGIGGRVMVKEENKIVTKLVDLNKTVVIPNVAIHLNREINKGIEYNLQIDTLPLFGSSLSTSLNNLIASNLSILEEEILGTDLFLYNKETGTTIGSDEEYFLAPRIDDLECAFTSLEAFINAEPNDDDILVYATFNHEEVGSSSNHGANSTFLIDTLERIFDGTNQAKESLKQALASSIIVSADNAHAIHYASVQKIDPTNFVEMNKGIVIKHNANLNYTTDAFSTSILKTIWDEAKVPYQEYTNRSNIRGGSTLGCISLSHVSIHSVDIGLAQLAMHSANETAGVLDIDYMINGLLAFYNAKISFDSYGNIIINK